MKSPHTKTDKATPDRTPAESAAKPTPDQEAEHAARTNTPAGAASGYTEETSAQSTAIASPETEQATHSVASHQPPSLRPAALTPQSKKRAN